MDSGPDLGILLVPDSIACKFVPSTKTFYNLAKRRTKVTSNPPPIDNGTWVLSGAPAEWTEEVLDSDSRFETVKKQGGLLGLGCVDREFEQDGFDYLEFLADYNASYEGPNRFGGCSGGGLWPIFLARNAVGEIIVTEKILSGVAFYECGLKANKRIVKCHGRKSVYRSVAGKRTP